MSGSLFDQYPESRTRHRQVLQSVSNLFSGHRGTSMLPDLTPDMFDKISAYGAYYLAAGSLWISFVTILVTVVVAYAAVRENRKIKQIDAQQKRFENSMMLFRIASGASDRNENGATYHFLQLAAIEALSDYPEYHASLVSMRNYYANQPQTPNNEELASACARAVHQTKSA